MQAVRGMKDWLGLEAWKREFVMNTIRKVFQSYGYEPMETPAIEYYETLATKGGGGEEIKKEIYYFKDKSDRELGLRFDLTVPTARVVASRPDIPKPYKRYTIGKVWRYDRPQAGRYREFTQADIDIFGSSSILADLEVIEVAVEVMKKLGFKEFKIRVNNRKVLEAMMLASEIPEGKILEAFRAIDKLDKIGWEGIRKELMEREIPNYEELLTMIRENDLEKVRPRIEGFDIGKAGLEELDKLVSLARDFGIDNYISVDLTLVRGLDYYTGNVFEVMAGGQWSCGGGGRYDKLLETYGGRPTPAVGISFGIERAIQLMDEFGLFPEVRPRLVYVAPVNKNVLVEAWRLARKLRGLGLATDLDLMERKLNKQFDYAKSKGYRWFLIVGERDLGKGKVTLKDLETGKEWEIDINRLEDLASIIHGNN